MERFISRNYIDPRLRGDDIIKVVFFGTPDFVVPVAESLLKTENCKLVAVVTNPDRPVGRKQILTPTPVKQWTVSHNIPILTPEKLDQNFVATIQDRKADLGILAAYGKIIPKEIIDFFAKGILVIHPSLLPKYRGASPAQAAIINGDKETGVSIIRMDEQMDHGPIVYQFKSQIKSNDTAESLYQRLFQETGQKLPEILKDYIFKGGHPEICNVPPKEQNHAQTTYTKLLKKEDGFIPYGIIASKRGSTSKCKLGPYEIEPTPENIVRFIRAMTPWPGAYTYVKLKMIHSINSGQGNEKLERRLKILKAHLEKDELVLDQVQLEGKKTVSWKQFTQAYPGV